MIPDKMKPTPIAAQFYGVKRACQGQKIFSGKDHPLTVAETELEHGMLSLINRGYIPKGSDLTPAMTRGAPMLNSQSV